MNWTRNDINASIPNEYPNTFPSSIQTSSISNTQNVNMFCASTQNGHNHSQDFIYDYTSQINQGSISQHQDATYATSPYSLISNSYNESYAHMQCDPYYTMQGSTDSNYPGYYCTQNVGEHNIPNGWPLTNYTNFSPPLPPEEPPPPPQEFFGPNSRKSRPRKICIILRGLPGSGKSTLARQIRDMEKSHGVAVRILSTDDYFLSEMEEGNPSALTFAKLSDTKALSVYCLSLEKALRRSVEDAKFDILVVDSCLATLSSFESLWSIARRGGYETLVAALEVDSETCLRRLLSANLITAATAETAREAVTRMRQQWEEPAPHMPLLDLRWLLGGGETKDVEMEEDDGISGRSSTGSSFMGDDDDDNLGDQNAISEEQRRIDHFIDNDFRVTGLSRCRISDDGQVPDTTGNTQSYPASQGSFVAVSTANALPSGCLKRARVDNSSLVGNHSSRDPSNSHSHALGKPSSGSGSSKRTRNVHWGDFEVIEIENTESSQTTPDGAPSKLRARRMDYKEGVYIHRSHAAIQDNHEKEDDDDNDNGVPFMDLSHIGSRGFEITAKKSNPVALLSGVAQERWRQEQVALSASTTSLLAAPEERLWKQASRAIRHGPDRDRRPLFRSSSGEPSNDKLFL